MNAGSDVPSHSIVLDVPERLTDVTSWHGHVPFAFWCIEALRPRVFVELGTHRGDSYSAFCQAVQRLGLRTSCFAVDTWAGDPQAGFYGEEVYEDLRRYHDARYASFSRLIRSTFDDAVSSFADGSIDLLHIDGLHTREAPQHDLETWLPKLSPSAVVLFHDINVHEPGFGVWRFWDEIRERYPHFTFLHSHGLGVLVVGSAAPEAAVRLAAASPEEAARIRAAFARLGEQVCDVAARRRTSADLATLRQQLTSGDAPGFQGARRALEDAAGELKALRRELAQLAAAMQQGLEGSRRALAEVRDDVARLGGGVAAVGDRIHAVGGRIDALRAERWSRRFSAACRRAGDALASGGPLQLMRRRKYAAIIRRSGLFQPEHYLAQLGGAPAPRDPLHHYVAKGAAAGLEPNAFFDPKWFAARHPSAAAPGKNPLVQYLRCDPATTDPGPAFDVRFYLQTYPDVAASGLHPVAHHLAHGVRRGRITTPLPQPSHARALSDELLQRAPALAADAGPGRVLVCDTWILTPDQDSGSVRMFAILKLLRQLGHAVTFVSASEERRQRYADDIRALGIDVLQGLVDTVAHLAAEGHRYRFVLLSRPDVYHRFLPAVRAFAIHATVLYDTVDLHWVRLERAFELSGDTSLREDARRHRTIELLGVDTADRVVAITEEEQRTLSAERPAARVHVVPNIHACRPSARPWSDRSDLMFIGGYDHAPNVDAVEWFVSEILPRVREHLPEVVLRVIGSKPPPRLLALASPGVDVLGWVPDVEPWFEATRVFVAPLRFGAGMKGKVGQAMAHGLPLVTTPIGAEGMGLVSGEHALVAPDAAGFADAVVRLYRDELLWSRLARSSLQHVQARFSEDAVRDALASLFSTSHTAAAGAGGESGGSVA